MCILNSSDMFFLANARFRKPSYDFISDSVMGEDSGRKARGLTTYASVTRIFPKGKPPAGL